MDGGRGPARLEMTMRLFASSGLIRRFDSTVAVDGLDLSVRRGEIYGFLGPNGAGKSTVVRILCTLLRPSAGAASVAGFDVVTDPQSVRTTHRRRTAGCSDRRPPDRARAADAPRAALRPERGTDPEPTRRGPRSG